VLFGLLTLKVVNSFPSYLAYNISNYCLTMWHKNYPLHLMYLCTLPCKIVRVKSVAKYSVISRYLLAKSRGLRWKSLSLI